MFFQDIKSWKSVITKHCLWTKHLCCWRLHA